MWITTRDAARLYSVTPATIRRWAQRDQWRRKPGKPVRWSWADAQNTYERQIMAKRRAWLDLLG